MTATWGPSWGPRRSKFTAIIRASVKFFIIAILIAFSGCPLTHTLLSVVKFGCLVSTNICWVWTICGQIVSRGACWKSFMLVAITLPPFRLILAISCLILVMRQIRNLDTCITTWPCSSLANSMRKAHAARLRHYLQLIDRLGMAPWPCDHPLLGQNFTRFVVHLVAKRSLQALTICSYLARIQLQLLHKGLYLKLSLLHQSN